MKHSKLNCFVFFISTLFAYSCIQQNNSINPNDGKSFSLLNDDNYKPHISTEVINGDYQTYMDYFVGTDYEIGISSCKDGALPGGSTISCISGISHVRKTSATKSSLGELPEIKSYVDGIEISPNLIQTKSSQSLLDCFGKVVNFSFSTNYHTKSSETTDEMEMYIPKSIEFTFPFAESEDDLNPLCYYKDFLIKWNVDEDNMNGVLVVVDWTGSMVLGNDIPNTHVCRLAIFPDTGEAKLQESLFDGIPDTAFCDLLILRGNVKNIEQGQYSYKFVGKTHQQISFILIREIDYREI